jgi:putative sterol carrier protein
VTEAATAFFEALARAGHHPMLESVRATVRFDLTDDGRTERWFLAIDKGDLTVSRRIVRADCVIRAERSVFEGLATGRVNAMAALLRGDLVAEGDPRVLVLLRRLFAAPPGAGEPRAAAASEA